MTTPAEEWIERARRELQRYRIGDFMLDEVFEPLLQACAAVAKTYNEFKQCVEEGVATLRSIIRKI